MADPFLNSGYSREQQEACNNTPYPPQPTPRYGNQLRISASGRAYCTIDTWIGEGTDLDHSAHIPEMPRRSNISQLSASTSTPAMNEEVGADANGNGNGKEKEGSSIEDLSLPRTMVQRLAKGVLPPNTQIQKDALTAMSKSATVFINYLSHLADAQTANSNRKTISPADVLNALRGSDFASMIPRLEAELAKHNEIQTGKRNEYRKKAKEGPRGEGSTNEGAGGIDADGTEEQGGIDGGQEASGGERKAKRARLNPPVASTLRNPATQDRPTASSGRASRAVAPQASDSDDHMQDEEDDEDEGEVEDVEDEEDGEEEGEGDVMEEEGEEEEEEAGRGGAGAGGSDDEDSD